MQVMAQMSVHPPQPHPPCHVDLSPLVVLLLSFPEIILLINFFIVPPQPPLFSVWEIEPRASPMLANLSITELTLLVLTSSFRGA